MKFFNVFALFAAATFAGQASAVKIDSTADMSREEIIDEIQQTYPDFNGEFDYNTLKNWATDIEADAKTTTWWINRAIDKSDPNGDGKVNMKELKYALNRTAVDWEKAVRRIQLLQHLAIFEGGPLV